MTVTFAEIIAKRQSLYDELDRLIREIYSFPCLDSEGTEPLRARAMEVRDQIERARTLIDVYESIELRAKLGCKLI